MSVILDNDVIVYLDKLTDTLIDKGYFSSYDASLNYIRKIVFHAVDFIPILPSKLAQSVLCVTGGHFTTLRTAQIKPQTGTSFT